MTTTNAESYLNEMVGRMALIRQQGGDEILVNVLSLNAIGLLVQDRDHEFFLPWTAVRHLRAATAAEINAVGSPEFRQRQSRPVLEVE